MIQAIIVARFSESDDITTSEDVVKALLAERGVSKDQVKAITTFMPDYGPSAFQTVSPDIGPIAEALIMQLDRVEHTQDRLK